MKTFLKVKIKSLAAEASIIKLEESRWRKDHPLRRELRLHRLNKVRSACRSATLAYGYIRGRRYRSMEASCHERPSFPGILQNAQTFGPEKDAKKLKPLIEAWLAAN